MDQSIVKQHLDEVLLFVLDVSLFHGNRKAKPADLQDALGVQVAEDDVLTLGVNRVFNKEWVNKLNRVKSAMERACSNAGAPFLSGWAVPEQRADEVAAELANLLTKGNAIKADILANFDAICADYAQQHPTWADVITRKGFSETYVRDRVHFGWHAIKVSAGREDGLIGDALRDEVGGLLGNLLAEVSKAASRFIKESLTGREAVTRKALRPIVAAREKLSGFTFLDSRVQPLCSMIDMLVNSMPQDGRIEGMHLTNLIGMANILTKPMLALEVGDKAASQDPDKVFEEFFATQTMVAAQSAPPAVEAVASAVVTPIQVSFAQPQVASSAPAVGMQLAVPRLPEVAVDYGNLF